MGSKRVYNFSAGPSMLPEDVLTKAASELLNYEDSGMSVMEMSHRSKVYDGIIKGAEAKLRSVMAIPDDYAVLFLQGGATSQFTMVPMNLATKSGVADYTLTGVFSKKSYQEGKRFCDARIAFDGKEENYSRLPKQEELVLTPDADYFHMCENNTIYGSKWSYLPETNGVPIVSDMSSCILSEPVDVSKYGVIYAGAQKNMGPAGLTVVIIRKDLLGEPQEKTPVMYGYKLMAENDSMYNTPPTYGIYILKLVLEWVESLGGLPAMQKRNQEKAGFLYDFLDQSKLFQGKIQKDSRSLMNVTFVTGDADLDAKFVAEAAAAGFVNLKGHRLVGGMRASIYNAMPLQGVKDLVAFMEKFEKENL